MSSDDSSPKSESLHCSEGVISLNDCGLVGGVSDTDTVRATGAVDIDAGGDNEHAVVGVAENGEYGIAIGLAVTSRRKSSLTVKCQQCPAVGKKGGKTILPLVSLNPIVTLCHSWPKLDGTVNCSNEVAAGGLDRLDRMDMSQDDELRRRGAGSSLEEDLFLSAFLTSALTSLFPTLSHFIQLAVISTCLIFQ